MREHHVFGCHNSRDRRLGAELRSQQLPLRAPWIAEKGDVNDWGKRYIDSPGVQLLRPLVARNAVLVARCPDLRV